MRYWGFFALKLVAAGTALFGVWLAIYYFWPEPTPFLRVQLEPFARDLPFTAAMLLFWLVCVGVLYLAVRDQRYRCRTCLRRLRMPVTTGSWDQMLLEGPPRTEYICPYGHGTLRVPDLQISGMVKADWRPIENMWEELYQLEESRK